MVENTRLKKFHWNTQVKKKRKSFFVYLIQISSIQTLCRSRVSFSGSQTKRIKVSQLILWWNMVRGRYRKKSWTAETRICLTRSRSNSRSSLESLKVFSSSTRSAAFSTKILNQLTSSFSSNRLMKSMKMRLCPEDLSLKSLISVFRDSTKRRKTYRILMRYRNPSLVELFHTCLLKW